MRIRMVEERIGEYLGPIDWTHPEFAKLEATEWGRDTIAMLRKIEAEPDRYLATTDGGSPKFGYKPVLTVGMYDGWPYWKPWPSFQIDGTLGAEWHSVSSLTGITERR